GLRVTEQRKAVISYLKGLKVSVSIKDIYRSLNNDGVKIDEASVYRFIETLKDYKLVHAHSDGKINLCSHQSCSHSFHYSVECPKCHKIYEPTLSKEKEKQLAAIFGLKTKSIQHIEVSSLCSRCS
ncbi:MAG: Fur family transcriptional regulator, partial [Bdellovibrionales bacterium]